MKLEHFGMAEPGDCRLVFTAGAEELAAAVAQVQAEPDAPQEEDGLLTEAVNRTILGGFSALYEQLVQEYHVVPVTDPDFELLAVNRAEGFRAGAQFFCLPPLELGEYTDFTQPIQQLSQVSNMLQSMAAAAERVFEFLNEPEEAQLADPARRADPADIDGQVTFDHVRFGYTPDKTVIHDFSCTVQPGQKVAIVGPTGAGKTTMVKLLMRFYDVDAGSITLNGHNVRDFDRSALREGFGMVLQDTWLFKGTIMENIRYGRLDATDEEVIAAAKAANADHFIRTLPGGYQMELNEDASNVSQGQKQLLTIARTILADNRILILDEATSSVDTRTEQRIQTAMDRLMEGRTSFVIAHRLSTIRDADLILVMRDGDIVEQGTHDQLIEAGGFYADLYNSQFEDVVD